MNTKNKQTLENAYQSIANESNNTNVQSEPHGPPTPETDSLFGRNGYPVEVDSSKAKKLCKKLEKERDWITEKYKLLAGDFKRAEQEREKARAITKEAINVLYALGDYDLANRLASKLEETI